MKKRLFISGVVLVVLVFAFIGWTLDAIAWTFRPTRLRVRPA
jgi:hypothetical protein